MGTAIEHKGGIFVAYANNPRTGDPSLIYYGKDRVFKENPNLGEFLLPCPKQEKPLEKAQVYFLR